MASIEAMEAFYSCVKENSLNSCFLSSEPLVSSLWLVVAFSVYCFVWSVITGNCSKVDQIWSITPFCFSWLFWYHRYATTGENHERLFLLSVLLTLWGLRLTYNFARRGGYGNFFKHEEDYRWPILRAQMHPVVFLIFNLTFIATVQNVILWLIASPSYLVLLSSPSITQVDLALAGLFLAFLVIETVADQQHYNFQQYKHSLSKAALEKASGDLKDGFLQSGLWKYSRHPNYMAEQAMWILVYLFSVSASGQWLNWTIAGIVSLMTLFQGSMRFGESITASKYPGYKTYQQRVSRCIPWFHSAPKKKSS